MPERETYPFLYKALEKTGTLHKIKNDPITQKYLKDQKFKRMMEDTNQISVAQRTGAGGAAAGNMFVNEGKQSRPQSSVKPKSSQEDLMDFDITIANLSELQAYARRL